MEIQLWEGEELETSFLHLSWRFHPPLYVTSGSFNAQVHSAWSDGAGSVREPSRHGWIHTYQSH